MRRLASVLLVTMMLCAVGPSALHAEPVRQASQVQILSPEMGGQVRGIVRITGSASVPDFWFYKVEFGIGPSPAEWHVIGELHYSPVISGQLEIWDTGNLPDRDYTLQLQAVRKDGNYEPFMVRQVIVANTVPTATPSPTPTPTHEATATASPTLAATETLAITGPIAEVEQPTPTPTLNRPTPWVLLSQKDWEHVQPSFLYGAAAMAAVFLLLGIVFGVRRLL